MRTLCQFFNDSTGVDPEMGKGSADKIVEHAGPHLVDSPLFKGKGPDAKPYKPVPESETTSRVDSTPVGQQGKKRAS